MNTSEIDVKETTTTILTVLVIFLLASGIFMGTWNEFVPRIVGFFRDNYYMTPLSYSAAMLAVLFIGVFVYKGYTI